MMEPADAALVAIHETRPVQNKGSSADSHKRTRRQCCLTQKCNLTRMQPFDFTNEPTDDDDVVELPWIA